MATNVKCPKCGSAQVVPSAHVVKAGPYGGKVCVSVASKPGALLFKGEELAEVRARVCGDCGHLEMFIREAKAVYRAHMMAESTHPTFLE